jgi:hypothetical protein
MASEASAMPAVLLPVVARSSPPDDVVVEVVGLVVEVVLGCVVVVVGCE